MAMAIQDGAARVAILEACMAEQDGNIDTLQCLHEGLRREIILRHPSFPLLYPPANATSLLLHQPILPSMSPPKSALPPLIDLLMAGMELPPLKLKDPSAIEGLMFEPGQLELEGPQMSGEGVMFEPSQVEPNGPQMSGDIVDPDPCHWFSAITAPISLTV